MPETYPPENQPVHFVLAEGETLISYAAIMEVSLNHGRNVYRVYGFGNMLTFPPFRRQGYGRQVLQAATRLIQASNVDVAILFCDPSRMMLFVSKKGLAHQKDFDRQPIYIDWPW